MAPEHTSPDSAGNWLEEILRELVLTPTEKRLLGVLASKPGQAFSRAELMALVMPDAVVLKRTIDVHIAALRKKLGPRARVIQTVRGVGYRLVIETAKSAID
jgi:DNA-binding response OmpR family regulator